MEFDFVKSSYSGAESGTCVEVARNVPCLSAVRDSKERNGAVLVFSGAAFRGFLRGVRAGRYDW